MRPFALSLLVVLVAPVFAQTTLQETAVLRPSDSSAGDGFGYALDADGDRLVVGAPWSGGTGAVYVFERVGAAWTEVARLVHASPQSDDRFGFSVSLDGDRLVVGAPGVDAVSPDAGAAFLFERSGGTWSQVVRLDPIDVVFAFGWDVALDGDRAIAVAQQGCAVVFEAPFWTPSDVPGACYFSDLSTSVALSGDRALIGWTGNLDIPGEVHAFHYDGTSWATEASLAVSGSWEDDFGLDVALAGNEILASGYRDEVRAYTFGQEWVTRDVIPRGSGSPSLFGVSLDLHENLSLLGDPELVASRVGTVYLHARHGTGWARAATLVASDAAVGRQFGHGVALDEQTAYVGAPEKSGFDSVPGAGGPGSVYVFDLTPGIGPLVALDQLFVPFGAVGVGEAAFREVRISNTGTDWATISATATDPAFAVEVRAPSLPPDAYGFIEVTYTPGTAGLHDADLVVTTNGPEGTSRLPLAASAFAAPVPFGALPMPDSGPTPAGATVLDAAGPYAVVGRPNAGPAGVVDLYEQGPGGWTHVRQFAPLGGAGVAFGSAVALRGTRLVVGAPGQAPTDVGRLYVFERVGGEWVEQAVIDDPDAAPGTRFGASIAWYGDDLLVGAPRYGTSPTRGAIYWLEEVQGWRLRERLDAPPNAAIGDEIQVYGDAFITLYHPYVFERSGDSWTSTRLDIPSSGGGFEYLFEAAMGEDYIAIGSPSYALSQGPPGEDLSGGVYLFARSGGAWEFDRRLEAPDAGIEGDLFGRTVVRVGEALFVGAPNRSAGGERTGAVYAVRRNGGEWQTPERLTPPDAVPAQGFGAVMGGGNVLLVGPVPVEDPPGLAYTIDVSALTTADDPVTPLPAPLVLGAVYPNPAGRRVTVAYALPAGGPVELVVFDLLGRRLRTLVDGPQPAGHHRVQFDAQGLASGTYLLRLVADGQVRSRTVVIAR